MQILVFSSSTQHLAIANSDAISVPSWTTLNKWQRLLHRSWARRRTSARIRPTQSFTTKVTLTSIACPADAPLKLAPSGTPSVATPSQINWNTWSSSQWSASWGCSCSTRCWPTRADSLAPESRVHRGVRPHRLPRKNSKKNPNPNKPNFLLKHCSSEACKFWSIQFAKKWMLV